MRGFFDEGQAEVPRLPLEELARRARSWRLRGVVQLVLLAAAVALLLAARFAGSFVLLAAGLVCLLAAAVLTAAHLRCPVCGRQIRKWERYFGALSFHCPNCGFSIHSGEKR
ncbi:MAG: hypothetical protein Q4C45_04475 [Oscillospiraceae bacterium]|nr:hypothetical protein [Oscillospiraceae bacterium]